MTIAEKYANLKGKSIKQMVLEIVDEIASKCKEGESLELTCGWWITNEEPRTHGLPFSFMAGECYHNEINSFMKEQGFKVYENYGGFRRRAYTTYRLE